jgi:hypothetical protein
MTWTAVAVTVYVAGIGLLLVRAAIGWRRARAIRRNAVWMHGRLTHPACVTPMTVGFIAPVVILPTDWTQWTAAELSAVLAHEEEHVRQRDPLVAGVALVNRALFWFHPLSWWLQRTIAGLSEHACDAVVISRGHDVDLYSSCLLRFARRAADAGGRIAPMAMAMPGAGLRERIRVLSEQLPAPPSRSRVIGAATAGAAIIVMCVAADPSAAPHQRIVSPAQSRAAWPVHLTDHFEIVHDNLPSDRVSDAVGDLEAAYVKLSAALKYDMPRRVNVVLVRQDRDVNAQAGSAVGPTSGGQRVVLSLESLDGRTGLVVHELTHQFAFDIVPGTSRIAPVLIEGLAEYQRGVWDEGDLRLVRAAAGSGAIPSTGSLVDTDRHWAHAVFDFVAAAHSEEGVRRLLFALRAHDTLPPAVSMAFGMTIEQFDAGFRDYVIERFGR